MKQETEVAITKAAWSREGLPKDFTVLIPASTPKWGLLMAIEDRIYKQFNERPFAYTMKVPELQD